MKRYYHFIAFVLMTICCQTLVSCGDDDGDSSSIVGVWKCTSVDREEWSRIKVGDIFTFKNDYTYTITGNYNESGKYTLNGNTLTIPSNTPFDYEITVSSTILTIRLKADGRSLTFSRQSGEGGGTSFTYFAINGKAYNLSSNQPGVFWNKSYGSGIEICTGTYGKTNPDEIYAFGFLACKNDTYCEPTVGLDISKLEYSYASMTLKFNLRIRDTKAKTNTECEYVSGSLIIVDINKSKETITLKFNDLKMRSGGDSYMFNGTITLPLQQVG